MKKLTYAVAASFALTSLVAVFAQSPSGRGVLTINNCLITAFDEVQLPAREQGALIELDRSLEGKEVQEGQVLGLIDNADALAKEKQAQFEIEIAQAQADSDAELNAAIKTKEVAEAEVASAEVSRAKTPGSVSDQELRRLKLTAERSKYEIEKVRVERANHGRTALAKGAQLDAARNELQRRKIVSPLDGVVVDFSKHRAEWVQPGETVCKIVRLDRLRVEGFVSAEEVTPASITGAKVVVSVVLPDGKKQTVEGEIEYVSPVVEASGEYRVFAQFDNRRDDSGHWAFRPGSVAAMDVTLRSANARTTTTSAPAAKFEFKKKDNR